MVPDLTPEERQSLVDLLFAGQKITAIKRVRELRGLGLAEAKQIIDRLEAELRTSNPDRLPKPKGGFGGCVVLLILLLLGALAIVWFVFLRART